MAAIGERLKEVRLARGLTQVEVAKQIGVTQAFLAMLEGGERPGSKQSQARVARWIASAPQRANASRGPYKAKLTERASAR